MSRSTDVVVKGIYAAFERFVIVMRSNVHFNGQADNSRLHRFDGWYVWFITSCLDAETV